jgi:kynurenine formamidase
LFTHKETAMLNARRHARARFAATLIAFTAATASATGPGAKVGLSPWGPQDEIGALNLMSDRSRAAVLSRISGGRIYDLSVEYFNGMPSWYRLGDPRFQLWLTHTPRGTAVDDPLGVGAERNELVAYTGDAVSMYTHTGTHIDALNHFGLHGEIWNGFAADRDLGDRGWRKAGVEEMPPIVARGVLIDVAAAKGLEVLPPSYAIGRADLEAALRRQGVSLAPGDVVLIRTGRMRLWPDNEAYMANPPGLGLEGARWLAEEQGAMVIGSDNLSLEHFPVETPDNWIPVHTYLLAQRGVPIVEVLDLEALARDRVYEFAFIAAPLRWRGASAAPFRPLALPLR